MPLFATMTHDLMVLMARDGTLISANQTFKDVLGYNDDEISTFSFLDLVHSDDRGHIRPQFKSLMQEDESVWCTAS